jgi:hypothetical protein
MKIEIKNEKRKVKLKGFFFVVCSFSLFTSVQAQKWSTVGSGVKGSYKPLYVFNGKLYAGGMDSVGKKATHIACWDGKIWTAPDSSFQGNITAMTEYNGKLYAGTQVGPDDGKYTGYNLLCWNDTVWKYLASTNGRINALCVVKGTLFVGGSFTKADTLIAKHIVKYTDTAGWAKAGSIPNSVWALITFRDKVYAGGQFQSVVRWTGKYWEDVLGPGSQFATGWVKCFVNYFDEIYACGEFDYLIKWDTKSWTPVGPFNGVTATMVVDSSGLFVGGDFTAAPNSDNVFHVVDYENYNRSWNCMGGVIYWSGDCTTYSGTVSSLALYKKEIYIGGKFTLAGNIVATNFAKYTLPPNSTLVEGK